MSIHTYSVDVCVDAATAFDLIHNYDRRLEWDSMLSEARLLDGATHAASGVSSRCVAHWRMGRAAVESQYVTFKPGQMAAVVMTRGPWCFESFAASIRHHDLGDGTSHVTYCFNLRARPRWLRFALEPILCWLLSLETRGRLTALAKFLRKSS